MKTVKDILRVNSLNSNTVSTEAMVIEAFSMMMENNIDYVIVKEGASNIGIVREVDYMSKIILPKKDPDKVKVKEIMASNQWSVAMNDSIYKCLELMDSYKIRHLLVFDALLFKGVITLDELMHAAFEDHDDKYLQKQQMVYSNGKNKSGSEEYYMNFDNN